MQDLETAPGIGVRLPAEPLALVLCSRVRGRERWHVPAMEGKPRLAAAVAAMLQSEDGVIEARANPLTGRVLVRYQPGGVGISFETLLRSAVAFGPMSREEYAELPAKQRPPVSTRHLIAAEFGCFLIKMMIFGAFCPTGAAAAALFMFWKQRSIGASRSIQALASDSGCLVVNQAR